MVEVLGKVISTIAISPLYNSLCNYECFSWMVAIINAKQAVQEKYPDRPKDCQKNRKRTTNTTAYLQATIG